MLSIPNFTNWFGEKRTHTCECPWKQVFVVSNIAMTIRAAQK